MSLKTSMTVVSFLLSVILLTSQVQVVENDVIIGTSNNAPVEKLEVEGNIVLNSSQTGGSLIENRNHLIYGKSGNKRLQFSTAKSSVESWSWINMFGDESCTDCEPAKKGNLSLGAQQVLIRTNNTDGSFGTVAATFDSQQDLHVTGSIFSNGNMVSSDIRLKKDISPFDKGLESILKLNPKTFYYNGKGGVRSTDRKQVGVIAQELQSIVPEAVIQYSREDPQKNEKHEYLAVDESVIKYMLVNAVQEQQKVISQMQKEIDELKALVNKQDK